MRILLVHNLPPWDPRAGGGQRVQHELAVHAAAAGHEVCVLYLGDGRGAPSTPYRIAWARERLARGLRLAVNTVAVARAFRRLLATWRPDVVHGSAAEAGLIPLVLPPQVALVATSHHPDPPRLPARLAISPRSLATLHRLQNAYLEAYLLRSAHRVVATSRWGAQALRERGYLPVERPIAVVHNGVAEAWFLRPEGPRDRASERAILFVGRLDRSKGWDVLLEALARTDAPRGGRLVVAGSGPDEGALRERASALGLDGRIELLGRLDPPALRARLADAAALVLPSRNENYPLVLLEAMAAGVPVVATRVGGVGELIVDERNGLLVPADDAPALARALGRATADAMLRDRLVAAGRATAERHHWDRIVARMEAEYRLAAELARPVARPRTSVLSGLYRRAAARTALASAPRAAAAGPPAAARRIAVVRPGRLGDLLLVDPLLDALASRYPTARIELVTDATDRIPPWMVAGGLVQRALFLREGSDAWRRPSDPERRASLGALQAAWAAEPPDLVIFALDVTDPVARRLSAELAAAAPTAWRAGLVPDGRSRAELHAAVDPGPVHDHEIERLLRLARAAGADGTFRLPRVPSSPSPLPAWDGPTVIVHPGASRPTKRWPLERWGLLATRLAALGWRVVAVGDPAERADVPALGIPFDERVFLDRVGALDLSALAAVVAGADAFAGNDSFPFHLAVAVGTPAVVLVGPGAARWSAYPVAHAVVLREPVVCSPRFGEECPVYTTCPHGACMQSISLDVVADTLVHLASEPMATAPR